MIERKPVRGTLTRSQILETAIELADREGIEAVTMRRVAAELGVQAMSLYHHVGSKQDLISGMAGHLLGTLAVDEDAHTPWQAMVRNVARGYRRLGLTHPAIFPAILERPLVDPASAAALETVFRSLREAGFSPGATLLGYKLVTSFVEGFTLDELNRDSPWGRHPSPDQLAPYPIVSEILRMEAVAPGDTFEVCLEIIVSALDRLRSAR